MISMALCVMASPRAASMRGRAPRRLDAGQRQAKSPRRSAPRCTRGRIGGQWSHSTHRCHHVRSFIARMLLVVAAALAGAAYGMTREEALRALEHPDPG